MLPHNKIFAEEKLKRRVRLCCRQLSGVWLRTFKSRKSATRELFLVCWVRNPELSTASVAVLQPGNWVIGSLGV